MGRRPKEERHAARRRSQSGTCESFVACVKKRLAFYQKNNYNRPTLFYLLKSVNLIKSSNHYNSNQMSDIASTASLNHAFCLVYQQAKHKGHNADTWALCHRWEQERSLLQTDLLNGQYHLSPLQLYNTAHGLVGVWSARDAVVLKALALHLTPVVQKTVGEVCFHLKGHGSTRGGARHVAKHLSDYPHVIQSDVADFYQSMNHDVVIAHCQTIIEDKRILKIIQAYLNRCEVKDGDHTLVEQGIPKGCPLSPLMGALILKSLDDCIPKDALYVRYMDDWVIAVKTKTQLRRMVKKMHQVMHRLKFKLAHAKTFIGKSARGFDFLGYRIAAQGIIGIAERSIQKHNERKAALYEQGASDQRILAYVQRWQSAFGLAHTPG